MVSINEDLLKNDDFFYQQVTVSISRHYGSSKELSTTKLYIDGKYVESKTNDWIELYNPATNEVFKNKISYVIFVIICINSVYKCNINLNMCGYFYLSIDCHNSNIIFCIITSNQGRYNFFSLKDIKKKIS